MANTMSTASEEPWLKIMSSKMLDVSESIIAPTTAKTNLRMKASRVAKNSGSLK
jgi:hypothetical protein